MFSSTQYSWMEPEELVRHALYNAATELEREMTDRIDGLLRYIAALEDRLDNFNGDDP